MIRSRRRRRVGAVPVVTARTALSVTLLAVPLLAAACSTGALPGPSSGPAAPGTKSGTGAAADARVVRVAAAENFWGSIVGQLGGIHARVVSVIVNPDTDPHSYEPTAADARLLATSELVVENGLGYDPWVDRLLAADGGTARAVLDVGKALDLEAGANPHRWYDPGNVRTVVARVTATLQRLDPVDATYFAARRTHFESVSLRPYDRAITSIRSAYAGTPVGASESIVAMLTPALGLDLVTPPSFLRAVSEGTDPSVADKRTIDAQIRDRRIRIYIYNEQNLTPDVQLQVRAARVEHIPVATVSETLQPAGDTYQAWQTRQLLGIRAALEDSRA